MKKLGLIVNPIAGMGGKAGLKGTDGAEILAKARELGSTPEAPQKAVKALNKLQEMKDKLTVYTASGDMGENEAKEAGLNVEVVYTTDQDDTTVNDTHETAKKLLEEEVDLILFVGGDGTARDIQEAVGKEIPVLGVPGGVKIYSAVHANSPEAAGRVAVNFLSDKGVDIQEAEVIDLDEAGFRNDEVNIKIFGYMNVPHDETHLQNLKSPTPQSDSDAQESAALHVIDNVLEDDVYYIIGSGSTPSQILKELDQPVTILGVDIMRNRETVAKDVNEQEILEILGEEKAKLIVTPMGGQGYILGRGNQQLSAKVLDHVDKDDLIIVGTPGKLKSLGHRDMLIYTMDEETDERLSGYYKVIVGYGREMMKKASSQKD